MALLLVVVSPAIAQEKYGELSGRVVTGDGTPLSSGRLVVFRVDLACAPDIKGINRVPDGVVSLDEEGRFHLELSPDMYFFGAVPRTDASYGGEMLSSKQFYLSNNRKEVIKRYTIGSGSIMDLGDILMTVSDRSVGDEELFFIRGRVVNDKGGPVESAVVMAKRRFDDLKPQFISLPTDATGSYILKITPGSYRLVARMQGSSFGRPKIKELFGIYGEAKEVGVLGKFRNVYGPESILVGERGDILVNRDITMFPIPDPEEIKLLRQVP